ncbi:FAD-binding oxidoreductase [Aestuariirhabdus sp. Z084]|uniref:NAD(P)/FAD-dependent oxidoreductase n=1 Tax=Aestuariirhabdus haliotis TaxID=2918751 RepID=UPI00201B40F0|nr:FAD-dependent oxidoreductase [Aestuariirhabdus haliotis]MCL6415555.1 FAD-binding oxidoreductase [Aestuariirhabdus haliotis]MCL6419240.1 FAD-binding oxidoreductase [Aestuariirhabdus haliotis]
MLYHPSAYDTSSPVPSYWEASVQRSELPTRPEPQHYDVVIIGGGFTGQSAALTFAEQGQTSVAVLDAGKPGWGASGRNGGFCSVGGTGLSYREIEQQFGQSACQHFLRMQTRTIERVAERAGQYAWNIDACLPGELQLAHSPKAFKAQREKQQYLQQRFDHPTELWDKSTCQQQGVDSPAFYGGLYVPSGFGLHPLKYDLALTRTLLDMGVHWHAETFVDRWQRIGQGFQIQTSRGDFSAKQLLIATNGYTRPGLLPNYEAGLMPVQSNILVTRPLSLEEQQQQGWHSTLMSYDSRHLLHYFRLLPDGRFLFGGRGGTSANPNTLAAMRALLTRDFHQLFPAWKSVEIEYFWRGLLCLSATNMPHVCELPDNRGAYVAMAFHGDGVAMGSWCGEQVARQMMGMDSDLPEFMRQPPKAFPLPGLRPLYLRAGYLGYHMLDLWS